MDDFILARIEPRSEGNYLHRFVDKSFLTRGGWWRSLHASWFREAN